MWDVRLYNWYWPYHYQVMDDTYENLRPNASSTKQTYQIHFGITGISSVAVYWNPRIPPKISNQVSIVTIMKYLYWIVNCDRYLCNYFFRRWINKCGSSLCFKNWYHNFSVHLFNAYLIDTGRYGVHLSSPLMFFTRLCGSRYPTTNMPPRGNWTWDLPHVRQVHNHCAMGVDNSFIEFFHRMLAGSKSFWYFTQMYIIMKQIDRNNFW